MDIPNLCSKANNSDLNSDLDCSDVDFDSDSQNKPNVRDADEKTATQKLKKLFFVSRVSTDSTETDCSIEFKSQTPIIETMNSHLSDNKSDSSMECDSSKKTDPFCVIQNVVSSTDDIEAAEQHVTSVVHETVDVITKCVPNDDCVSVSVGHVIDTNVTLDTDLTENSI